MNQTYYIITENKTKSVIYRIYANTEKDALVAAAVYLKGLGLTLTQIKQQFKLLEIKGQ